MNVNHHHALPLLVVLAGPTAAGKTDISIELANNFNSPIIGCDSRQFYKELKIGTAPPSAEQLAKVPHYFIHFLSIHDYYNVSQYETDVLKKLSLLFQQHSIVFLVGGSGLYMDAVCSGIDEMPNYDTELRQSLIEQLNVHGIEWLRAQLYKLDLATYKKIDLNNKNRVLRAVEVCLLTGKPYSSFLKNTPKERNFRILKIVLTLPREQLYQRINQRTDDMIEHGLMEEAKAFYPYRELTALKTVGYKELFEYFDGKTSFDETVTLIKRNTRHYARKQLTWFRRDTDFRWFDVNHKTEILTYIKTNFEHVN
jgi:tRNA dimethylallyltransferase